VVSYWATVNKHSTTFPKENLVDIKLSLIVSFTQRPKYWEEYQIFGAYSGNTGGRINVTTQPAKCKSDTQIWAK
jgi:hypothetical protein